MQEQPQNELISYSLSNRIVNSLLYLYNWLRGQIIISSFMFLFGGKKNEPKKIEANLEDRIKTTIKGKLCPMCNKVQSGKVAFGQGVEPSITCNNCQLKAVGNTIQRLGPKNLITADKFSSLLTSELISYQKGLAQTPVNQKDNPVLAQTLDKKAKQISTSIKTEFYSLRELSKAKIEELAIQAEKQNAMPIFDETLKIFADRKAFRIQWMSQVIKRSLVGTKGVHFVDQQKLQAQNAAVDQRFQSLKKQTKVKLKNITTLINDINNIKIQ